MDRSSPRRLPRFWSAWPRLHRYLAATAVIAAAAAGWTWHELTLARRGVVGPSYGLYGQDSPVVSYGLGFLAFAVVAVSAALWLLVSLFSRWLGPDPSPRDTDG